MARIYVAGSSKELDRCERLIARVRAMGHEITHDWTASVRANGGEANAGLSERERLDAAVGCYNAACGATFVVVLAAPVMNGAMFELGAAYAADAVIGYVGDEGLTIFSSFADHVFVGDEAALAWLEGL
jgi:hypothetical protein